MRILMVNKFLYPNGGSETYIFKLGEYLSSQGNEVQYFGMEHKDRCVSNHAEAYTTNMEFKGKLILSKYLYPLKTIYSSEARKKIRLVLNDFKPDIIHLNNFNYQLTPAIILEIKKYEKDTGNIVRIIYTAHDYQLVCPNHMLNNPGRKENCEKCLNGSYMDCIKGKCIHNSRIKSLVGAAEAYFWKWKKTYHLIDTVICPTYFMENKLKTNSFLSEKTIVLHNFIDKAKMRDIKKEEYVLYFGRYSEEKGIKTLIDLCKELTDIRFIFAGSGPLDNLIEGIPNIENVGFQTGEALEMLIRKARFSIYPSEWYENCPFSVMESQIYGTPVLGADIGGIPELIDNGMTGELFKRKDIQDLKSRIIRMWKDDSIIYNYSENCKKVKFDTLSEYCEKLMKIYKGE